LGSGGKSEAQKRAVVAPAGDFLKSGPPEHPRRAVIKRNRRLLFTGDLDRTGVEAARTVRLRPA